MREIKFKAKSKKTNEWVYGDLIQHYNGIRKRIITEEPDEDGELVEVNTEVIPYTVCQLITTINDLEIYKGDYVFMDYNDGDGLTKIGSVEFNYELLMWMVGDDCLSDYVDSLKPETIGSTELNDVQVTGNIHD